MALVETFSQLLPRGRIRPLRITWLDPLGLIAGWRAYSVADRSGMSDQSRVALRGDLMRLAG